MSKCECKTCVHEEVCNGNVSIDYFTSECDHYKDKSLCVELAYQIGQIVYVLRSQTSNGKNLYLQEERIDHYRVFYNVVFMCFESGRISVANHLWETRVFTTKEDAEKELKKRYAENK